MEKSSPPNSEVRMIIFRTKPNSPSPKITLKLMKPKPNMFNISSFAAIYLLTVSAALAQSGTWTPTTAGPFDWTDAATENWSGGTVASGADNTANFTSNITVNQLVNLAEARTIGNIVFNDASNDLTISGDNILTLATTSPAIPTLSVTGGATRLLTIATEIAGDDGLRKDGIGRLSLTGTNTYTGGTFINGGEIRITSDANLGDSNGDIRFTGNGILAMANSTSLGSGRTISVDSGFIGSLQSPNGANSQHVVNVAGQLTGDGGFSVRAGYQLGSLTLNSTNTNNDFKGALIIGRSAEFDVAVSTVTLNIASLADGETYGNIIFGRGNGSTANSMTLAWSNGADSALVLDHRQIQLDSANEQASLLNNNSNTANTITVNTDLLVSRAGSKTFTLGGSNTGANTFSGDISNGSGTVAIAKTGAGTWNISGNMSRNLYSWRAPSPRSTLGQGEVITFRTR
jgi:autotransporter-associated beta strand protein